MRRETINPLSRPLRRPHVEVHRRPQRAPRERAAASQQYIAIATFYDGETLPQLAAYFYRRR